MEALTITLDEACLRHVGLKRSILRLMCIRGTIKAMKVGKTWHVPIAELDRVFMGINTRGRKVA